MKSLPTYLWPLMKTWFALVQDIVIVGISSNDGSINSIIITVATGADAVVIVT